MIKTQGYRASYAAESMPGVIRVTDCDKNTGYRASSVADSMPSVIKVTD